MATLNPEQPVCVSLQSLEEGSISFDTLKSAFGQDSLGILLVNGLPTEYIEMRRTLLSYSSYLANLTPDKLATLENAASHWLVGWSCGKETLKDGRFDTLKGSYYVNCAPGFEDTQMQDKLITQYPSFPQYTARNVWPAEDDLPGFKTAFLNLCQLIIKTAVLVARACDRYALAELTNYRPGYLEHVVESSVSTKARLLHYFPRSASNLVAVGNTGSAEDDWCGTHVDHGALTGLTSAMFVDEAEHRPSLEDTFEPLPELNASPDPKAGLYILSRAGVTTKVNIPRDCLAFQTGKVLEIITEGQFRAVPHFVRGPAAGTCGSVARNTLAVFTQPNLWEKLDENRDFAAFSKEVVESNH